MPAHSAGLASSLAFQGVRDPGFGAIPAEAHLGAVGDTPDLKDLRPLREELVDLCLYGRERALNDSADSVHSRASLSVYDCQYQVYRLRIGVV